jgi:opacity protein-like surface antigen
MTKSLLVFLLASTSAYAADMYPVKAPVAPVVAAPVSNWAGFYVGVDGGYGWGNSAFDPLFTVTGFTNPITNPFTNPAPTGFLFGGHGGYNWQFMGNVVAGLEVDYLSADMTSSQTVGIGGTGSPFSATLATKVDALASGRAKLGYAVTPNFLIYTTGGVAWGHESATGTISKVATQNTGPAFSISQTAFGNQFGWVAGSGAEMKAFSNILLRVQYLHYSFGDVTYNFPLTVLGASAKTTVDAITGGISYKFDTF